MSYYTFVCNNWNNKIIQNVVSFFLLSILYSNQMKLLFDYVLLLFCTHQHKIRTAANDICEFSSQTIFCFMKLTCGEFFFTFYLEYVIVFAQKLQKNKCFLHSDISKFLLCDVLCTICVLKNSKCSYFESDGFQYDGIMKTLALAIL